MRKFLRYAHRYLGYGAGVIVVVTCLTGAILLFEKEITSAVRHNLYSVAHKQGEQQIPAEVLLTKVKAALKAEPVSLTVGYTDTQSWVLETRGDDMLTYINPYTGEVLGQASARHPFFIWVMKLHRFLLADEAGRVVVGISTIIFTLLLVSGLIVWLPRYAGKIVNYLRNIRRRYAFAKGANRYRRLYDWHVMPALLALPLLLIMALTGPTWSFKWYRSGFYAALGAKAPERKMQKGGQDASVSTNFYRGISSAIASVKKADVEAQSLTVMLPEEKGTYSINTLGKNPLTRRQTNSYTYSIDDNKIVKKELWKDKPREAKLPAWVYAFHTGTWGGVYSKVLYLAAVLVGTALPILGFLMLLARKRKRAMMGVS